MSPRAALRAFIDHRREPDMPKAIDLFPYVLIAGGLAYATLVALGVIR